MRSGSTVWRECLCSTFCFVGGFQPARRSGPSWGRVCRWREWKSRECSTVGTASSWRHNFVCPLELKFNKILTCTFSNVRFRIYKNHCLFLPSEFPLSENCISCEGTNLRYCLTKYCYGFLVLRKCLKWKLLFFIKSNYNIFMLIRLSYYY